MNSTLKASLLCLLVTLAGCQNSSSSRPTAFALIGDNPYAAYSYPRYERMIDDINSADVDFVVHVGDMKDSVADCSDGSFRKLYEINQRFRVPFILTPGDNDWFDCAREQAGGWERLDRLDRLREIFYRAPSGLDTVSQRDTSFIYRDFVENVYWLDSNVLFANVHLVGVTGLEGGMALHHDVQGAAVEWLQTIFSEAARRDVAGVFLATQADMYPFTGDRSWLKTACPRCPPVRPFYEAFHQALLTAAHEFKKPILLAVGDTHIFRVDKPLYDGNQLVEHFTRVEAFGEDQVHWVRIVVKPASPQVFHIHEQIIPENTGPPPQDWEGSE